MGQLVINFKFLIKAENFMLSWKIAYYWKQNVSSSAPACTVEGFHTKGWTKFFSVHIFNFCGQNNIIYDSVTPQAIFW
jgi:hypothetical protein